MVVYNLVCDNQHSFEGWFASAALFDEQQQAEAVTCPVCGSPKVIRRPTAAYLNTKGGNAPDERKPVAMTPRDPAVLWAKMVEYIRRNTEDVGREFPEHARKIHYREVAPRNIRGTASVSELTELHEEGIEVFPLPAGVEAPEKLQ